MKTKDTLFLEEAYGKVVNHKLQSFKKFSDKYIHFEEYLKKIIEEAYEITSMDVNKDLYMSFFPLYIEDVRETKKSFPEDIEWYYNASTQNIIDEYEGMVHMKLYDKAIEHIMDDYGGYQEFKKDWKDSSPEEKNALMNHLANKAYHYLLDFYGNADEGDFKAVFKDTTYPGGAGT